MNKAWLVSIGGYRDEWPKAVFPTLNSAQAFLRSLDFEAMESIRPEWQGKAFKKGEYEEGLVIEIDSYIEVKDESQD